jgi:hypothetical protein
MKTSTLLVVVFVLICAGLIGAIGAVSAKSRDIVKLRAENAKLKESITHLNGRVGELLERVKQERQSASAGLSARRPAVTETKVVIDSSAADDLKVELADKDREINELRAKTAEAKPPAPERDQRTFGDRMQTYWDKLKKENPEEFARIQEERRQRTQQAADMTRERSSFLQSVSAEGVSEEYVENHRLLVQKMALIDQAMAQIAADPNSQASHDLRHQIFTNSVGMPEMLKKERQFLLSDMAQDLGYKDQNASNFVQYVNYINEVTSLPHEFGGHGRGGPRNENRGPSVPRTQP